MLILNSIGLNLILVDLLDLVHFGFVYLLHLVSYLNTIEY